MTKQVVSLEQFIEDFMATGRGERPAPDYAGKTVCATQRALEEAQEVEKNPPLLNTDGIFNH